jgi:predicted Zn-dependent protease
MKIRLLALLLLVAPVVMAEGLPDLGEAAQADLSPQTERKIGESIMQDIRLHESSYVDDPEIAGYLNRLGKKLVAQSEGTALPDFEFFVLRDATLNAFALPGGFIGVHTGLILAAQSESELASVLSHEIGHVTQHHMARSVTSQGQAQIPAMVAMAVALLAARSNPDVAMGAVVSAQAASVQNQLNYSRDFEREADRLGLQTLERSGYDVRGMAAFFERLQKFGRLYENNAPGYLRTHPLTTERITDIENRIALRPYRQVPDSLGFQLVRAKIKADEGAPRDAVIEFQAQVKDRKFFSEPAARYGLAYAYARAKDYAAVDREVADLRHLKIASPMVETLAAEARLRQGDAVGAIGMLRAAQLRYPEERGLTYALVDTLLENHQENDALRLTKSDLQAYPGDGRMHGLQAKTYVALGKRLQQHRAQAESYAAQGQLLAAIEQLQLAQKSPDGDFYEYSQVDARLRELKARQAEEAKQQKQKQ